MVTLSRFGMTRRRLISSVLAASVVAAPARVRAQAGAGKRRIGFLLGGPRSSPGVSQNWDAIVEELRELGYIEGQNVVFEYAYTDGEPERRTREAARLVAAKPDIIAGVGSDARALREATTTIPIVVASGGDLVGMRIAASLANPGGNVTGLQMLSPELAGKRLELLRTASPKVRRVVRATQAIDS